MDLLQLITLDDLPIDQRKIAELVGIENYRKLVENYGGNDIRILQKATLVIRKRDEEIIASFTGSNARELARKYRLSDRTIREIVSTKMKHRKKRKKDGV